MKYDIAIRYIIGQTKYRDLLSFSRIFRTQTTQTAYTACLYKHTVHSTTSPSHTCICPWIQSSVQKTICIFNQSNHVNQSYIHTDLFISETNKILIKCTENKQKYDFRPQTRNFFSSHRTNT